MIRHFILLICIQILFAANLKAQVTHQTGSATFSLPIFSWQDNNSRLNTAVSLNYNSGNGLKVNEVASNLGQGWILQQGGIITRVQVGEPDDQEAYEDTLRPDAIEDLTKYPAGYLYTRDSSGRFACPLALTRYPIFKDINHVYKKPNTLTIDREFDYFVYQFNGRSGMFVLNYQDSTCLFLDGSSMKGRYFRKGMTQDGIRTTIYSFVITDETGLIFKFNTKGLTKVLNTRYCDWTQSRSLTQPKFKKNHVYHTMMVEDPAIENPFVVDSWSLSEIEDPLIIPSRKISFTYLIQNLSSYAGSDISYNSKKDYSIISHRKSVTKTPLITGIVFPDKHAVVFNYGSSRFDLKGGTPLASIEVAYGNLIISKYLVNTKYFILNRIGTPQSEYDANISRLCLQSIQKVGPDLKDVEQPYIFDYYVGSNADDDFVPPPFFALKDIFGYYNGRNSVAYSGSQILFTDPKWPLNLYINAFDNNTCRGLTFQQQGVSGVVLNPKVGYAKNGLLRQIIYPTGGTLTYEYSQNTGDLKGNGQEIDVGGVHVSKTIVTDGGYLNGCGNPMETRYDYVLNKAGNPSSLWGLEMPVNMTSDSLHYMPEYKHYKFPFACDYKFKYPGILSLDNRTDITGFQKFLTSSAMDAIDLILSVVDIIFISHFSVESIVLEVIARLIEFVVTCLLPQNKDERTATYYNFDLNNINPLPKQFRRVEVIQASGQVGKRVYTFTNAENPAIPLWVPPGGNPNFTMRQRFGQMNYGLPDTTVIFDADGFKVKEVIYKYNFGTYNDIKRFLLACKCIVFTSNSQRNEDWKQRSKYNAEDSYIFDSIPNLIKTEVYSVLRSRTELAEVIERDYTSKSNSEYIETKTKYQYNLNNQVREVTIIKPNLDTLYRWIRYNTDFNGGVMQTLNSKNIVSIPVAVSNAISTKNSNGIVYLNERVTDFTFLLNSDIRPKRILEQRFSTPKTSSEFHYYQGPSDNYNGYVETESFAYDGRGNLIGTKDEAGRSITNIYDSSYKFIIGTVINADPLVDKAAYSSFENEISFGGWILNGTPSYSLLYSTTGARSFSLTPANSLAAPLNTQKNYKLSFWSRSVVSVSGSPTLIKSGPKINGFTYYEYLINKGTSTVTLSGKATIDELRIYPASSQMKTTTYNQKGDKISDADENNRITYYEYDDMGRLQMKKDENKNIIKLYEYNSITIHRGCPGVYYSRAITQLFQKTCPVGYLPTYVTYSVPANKYSSAISQADADQKAENDLNTNGPIAAASSGDCLKIYYNKGKTAYFTSQNCPVGSKGGQVAYAVPAKAYSSTLNQAEVDTLEQEEIDANGQAFANNPQNTVCIISYEPEWEGPDTAQLRCQKINNQNSGRQEAYLRNINPNSPTYNTWKWVDIGQNLSACPVGPCGSCNLEGQKCINGNCETGTKVINFTEYDSLHDRCYVHYHYKFSDGSTSSIYMENTTGSCP